MHKPAVIFACIWAVLLFTPMASASYTFFLEPGNAMYELEMKQPVLSLKRVYFNVPEQNGRFSVRIDKVDANLDWIYEYIVINTTGLQGEPDYVVFDIQVNKSWIKDKNIGMNTLSLLVYGRNWEKLSMTPVSEDADFFNYRVQPPKLASVFALSGEPVPVGIRVTSPCDGDGICEPERGEDSENCPECVAIRTAVCVPAERYCIDSSNLLVCNDVGSDYSVDPCGFGCADGKCLTSPASPLAGMLVGANPLFASVVAILLMIIIYLAMLVKRVRGELTKAEKRKKSYEDIKAFAK